MKQYLDLIKRVLDTGEWTENRTGIKTLMVPGAMMTYDLRQGFPAVTTKKLAFKSVVGELCAFLRAKRSAADFRALGCKVWDQNANENQQWLDNPYRTGHDDLGPVYGVQWREWPGFKFFADHDTSLGEITHALSTGWEIVMRGPVSGAETQLDAVLMYKEIDQLGDCVRTIINNPDSRRILFHGWNPAVLDQVALPACHLLYQFLPNRNTDTLHMNVYLRSNDLGLGAPFNIAESATLQYLIARLTGMTAGLLNIMIGDAHIYENHLDMVKEQLTREPMPAPQLLFSKNVPVDCDAETAVAFLSQVLPEDFILSGYEHHAAISAPMAV